MTNEIKYTFYKKGKRYVGLLNVACTGKKAVYDGYFDRIECYSLNYNSFKMIAVYRLKSWKEKSLSNSST